MKTSDFIITTTEGLGTKTKKAIKNKTTKIYTNSNFPDYKRHHGIQKSRYN